MPVLALGACGRLHYEPLDAGREAGGGGRDAAIQDAAVLDAGSMDAGSMDAGAIDAGAATDAGGADAGGVDAGSGADAGTDAGAAADAGTDAGPSVDGGPGGTPIDVGSCSPRVALGDPFTVGSITFAQESATTDAMLVEGDLATVPMDSVFGSTWTGFDASRTLGRLLGESRAGSWSARFEGASGTANVVRASFRTTWGGAVLPNGAGPDLLIVEENISPEAFTIAVVVAGTTIVTPRRYRFLTETSGAEMVGLYAIDLSDFGVPATGGVTEVQIGNVFSAEAAVGADRVDDPSGQGVVIRAGEPGYATAHPLLDGPSGVPYTDADLDADMLYAAGLHPLRDCP